MSESDVGGGGENFLVSLGILKFGVGGFTFQCGSGWCRCGGQ